ncbi:Mor transcription activator family protein [Spartinivicinus ruber]|uniref:Mor transcription activator family protein n=1 Tax=Spartinivicinus ruber TaxID=2683272 RepID=UPI0013CFFFF2|nr:Mor transcription activator family protein [Spartinivicinus ruber]
MSIMNELTETIGEQAAIKLGQCLGGARLYIPRVIGKGHLITLAVGHEAANKIAARLSGQTIHFPTKNEFKELRNQLIRKEYINTKPSTGVSRADLVALKYALSRRQVFNIIGCRGRKIKISTSN